MSEDLLLHPSVVIAVFLVAAYLKFQKEMIEEVLSYLFVAAWFLILWVDPSITAITARVVGRWVLVQVPAVVIFFHLSLWWYRRQYKKSIMDGGNE